MTADILPQQSIPPEKKTEQPSEHSLFNCLSFAYWYWYTYWSKSKGNKVIVTVTELLNPGFNKTYKFRSRPCTDSCSVAGGV